MRTWHIWVVGIVTLLWHAGGAYDYLMTNMRNAEYLEMIPADKRPAFLAFLDAMPGWAKTAWAFGVWGSVAGSLLILVRSRHAVTAFAVALLGLAVSSVYTYLLAPPSVITSPDAMTLAFTGAIVVVLVAVLYYARRQTLAGNLR
jgi:hypothetical protein